MKYILIVLWTFSSWNVALAQSNGQLSKGNQSNSQNGKRTVKGVVLSDKNEPIPGVTITEIGKYQHGTISNLNGEFLLTIENNDNIYIALRGMHFDRYLKYEKDESFKKIIFKYKGSKKAERKSRRIYNEWKKLNDDVK